MSRIEQELIRTLRRDRKAALRQCGHLGAKLHTARLEVESMRTKIKKLEWELTLEKEDAT